MRIDDMVLLERRWTGRKKGKVIQSAETRAVTTDTASFLVFGRVTGLPAHALPATTL
jgi:hypothetical protein